MTQFDFDLICRLIQAGAPALAADLIEGLTNVITTANEAIRERDQLKEELARRDAASADSCKEENRECDK